MTSLKTYMLFTNVIPYLVLSLIFLLLAHAIVKLSPFYKEFLQGTNISRYDCLDGLRGFLALGVFFAHALVTHQYYLIGHWTVPPVPFYTTLAEVSVALFFMISGFLFWRKALDSESPMQARRLYRSRFKRLTPLFVFSAILVFIIVAFRTNFELNVPLWDLMKQVVSWLSFGFLGSPPPDINGLKDTFTIESIYWTLTFEWEFYLLLPLLSRLPFRTASVVLLMFLAGYLFSLIVPVGIVLACFGFGVLAAYLIKRGNLDNHLKKSRSFSLLAVLILALVLIGFDQGHGAFQYIAAFSLFILILQGNDLFGLLRTKAAKLLGTISYSIYLLHNIVLNVIFHNFNKIQDIKEISLLTFWGLTTVSGIAVILLSLLTYRYIEHPFLVKKGSHYS